MSEHPADPPSSDADPSSSNAHPSSSNAHPSSSDAGSPRRSCGSCGDCGCGDCGCCCCAEAGPPPEPSPLGQALERMIGVVAAFCLVALMIGGTIALLRWWL